MQATGLLWGPLVVECVRKVFVCNASTITEVTRVVADLGTGTTGADAWTGWTCGLL